LIVPGLSSLVVQGLSPRLSVVDHFGDESSALQMLLTRVEAIAPDGRAQHAPPRHG
jgi:hypothetical protein